MGRGILTQDVDGAVQKGGQKPLLSTSAILLSVSHHPVSLPLLPCLLDCSSSLVYSLVLVDLLGNRDKKFLINRDKKIKSSEMLYLLKHLPNILY